MKTAAVVLTALLLAGCESPENISEWIRRGYDKVCVEEKVQHLWTWETGARHHAEATYCTRMEWVCMKEGGCGIT